MIVALGIALALTAAGLILHEASTNIISLGASYILIGAGGVATVGLVVALAWEAFL